MRLRFLLGHLLGRRGGGYHPEPGPLRAQKLPIIHTFASEFEPKMAR